MIDDSNLYGPGQPQPNAAPGAPVKPTPTVKIKKAAKKSSPKKGVKSALSVLSGSTAVPGKVTSKVKQ